MADVEALVEVDEPFAVYSRVARVIERETRLHDELKSHLKELRKVQKQSRRGPVLDLEENVMRDQNNQPDSLYEPLTATNMTLWAETFIDRIEDLTGGVEPVVYMNSTFARDNC